MAQPDAKENNKDGSKASDKDGGKSGKCLPSSGCIPQCP